MTINIGDAVKTHWGDGTVTAIYESNGFGRTGLKLLIEWIDVEIWDDLLGYGVVHQMLRHHIINPNTGEYYDEY